MPGLQIRPKVYVKRRGPGALFLSVDENDVPQLLTSIDDQPMGTLDRQTSPAELSARFGHCDIVFMDAPPKQQQVIRRDERISKEAAAILGSLMTEKKENSEVSANVTVAVKDDARSLHAEEFLKRLEVARQYASKKNQAKLDVQIAVVRELLDEVFGR